MPQRSPLKMMFMTGVTLMVTSVISGGAFANGPACAKLFASNSDINAQIQALVKLRLQIDEKKSQGRSSVGLSALEADYAKLEQNIVARVQQNQLMTTAELVTRIRDEAIALQSVRREPVKEESTGRKQSTQIENSLIDGTRLVGHRIESGTFKMGEPGKQTDVTIEKPFEMMATLTTNLIWNEVIKAAKQRFPGQFQMDSRSYPSFYEGDTRPVYKVSYEDVQNWIRALNELSRSGDPRLQMIIAGHQTGDVYRLPTEAEWEFVARGRGQYNDLFSFAEDSDRLAEYAWHYVPSESDEFFPPMVAKKKPLVIDGGKFYDLLGNLWEWVESGSGVDKAPQLRGGSYDTIPESVNVVSRFDLKHAAYKNDLGFRLVREVKN